MWYWFLRFFQKFIDISNRNPHLLHIETIKILRGNCSSTLRLSETNNWTNISLVNIANCLSFNFGASFYSKITTASFDVTNFTDKYEQIDNTEKPVLSPKTAVLLRYFYTPVLPVIRFYLPPLIVKMGRAWNAVSIICPIFKRFVPFANMGLILMKLGRNVGTLYYNLISENWV